MRLCGLLKNRLPNKHIRNIFQTQELEEISVCSILELTAADGKKYMTQLYNLDMILSNWSVSERFGQEVFRLHQDGRG